MTDFNINPHNLDSMNRFNNIIQGLPLRTRVTINSLGLLDNITTQLLRFLIFNSNSPQLLAVFTNNTNFVSSGETETFQTLLKLFKQIRLIYNTRSPLLNVHDVAPGLWFPNSPPPLILRGHETFIITVIRKVNLLTFILTALHCFNYGFDLLQSTFLDIFCPNTLFTGTTTNDQNGKFLKSQAILYLDLKTQALISGLKYYVTDSFYENPNHSDPTSHNSNSNMEIPKDKLIELLDEIFPLDLSNKLIERRLGNNIPATNNTLTPSEKDFIERCDRRRDNLLNFNNLDTLMKSYDWNHFIKELLDYCNKNMGLIIWGRKGRGKSPLYLFDSNEFDQQILFATNTIPRMDNNIDNNTLDNNTTANNNTNNTNSDQNNIDGSLSHNNENDNTNMSNDTSLTNQGDISFNSQQLLEGTLASTNSSSTQQLANDIINAQANEELNNRLKQNSRMTQYIVNAAVASANMNNSNGIKKIKSKRTWSKEEEISLINGLKDVGPSWSKILDLYGPGGKISEGLKNRSQVQLKDKARNWKLQYLKSGKDLPDYLIKVTGSLDKNFKSKKKPYNNSNNNNNDANDSNNIDDKINNDSTLIANIDPTVDALASSQRQDHNDIASLGNSDNDMKTTTSDSHTLEVVVHDVGITATSIVQDIGNNNNNSNSHGNDNSNNPASNNGSRNDSSDHTEDFFSQSASNEQLNTNNNNHNSSDNNDNSSNNNNNSSTNNDSGFDPTLGPSIS